MIRAEGVWRTVVLEAPNQDDEPRPRKQYPGGREESFPSGEGLSRFQKLSRALRGGGAMKSLWMKISGHEGAATSGQTSLAGPTRVFGLLLVAALAPMGPSLLLLAGPMEGRAQGTDEAAAADSASLVQELRELQDEFEGFRQSRIPPQTRVEGFRCDERIGRFCHWFGGADEANFPPEPVETEMARRELLGELSYAWNQFRDPWILGQLVRYLVEDGRTFQASQVARECGLPQSWWCHALLGYALHVDEDFPGAEAAFQQALAELPESEVERWTTPRYILSAEGRQFHREAGPENGVDREEVWDRLWRFSNPLFLVEGNDRLTDHYARLVVAHFKKEAGNPFRLPWEEDMEESLVRYGRSIGWSRSQQPTGGPGLQDTRSTVSHHHPGSRGYLFPEEFLESPADIPPEAWITAPREARTWYAPSYAPDFRGLETQVARFRRGDSLLVVGAFRPDPGSLVAGAPERIEAEGDPFTARSDPFRSQAAPDPEGPPSDPAGQGPAKTGLFLVPEDGGEPASVEGDVREGVLSLRAPTGRYVSSLEVLDRGAGAAWRARQGVSQDRLERGQAGVSDLLLLEEGAPLPDDLDEAIPLARRGIRIRTGERFAVAWEVYGLAFEETARVTLGFTEGRPGFLQQVGEFLGILDPDDPVEISFDEAGRDEVQTLFRALHLELPDLEPGEYTLHLSLDLPGRDPAVASRPIMVEGR